MPCKGRGKVVFGFLLFNLGLVFLLDTTGLVFSLGLVMVGLIITFYGHIEHYFAVRAFRRNQETEQGNTS
jgi:hypothetical protein